MYQTGVTKYRQVGIKDQIAAADPHRITQILMQTALENLAVAKGCIERGDQANKAKPLGKATSIITSLRDTLDHEKGGEIAVNLDSLYTYILDLLVTASVENNASAIGDVIDILMPIKEAWDQIPESAKEEAQSEREANA